jgi:hypothetical protein
MVFLFIGKPGIPESRIKGGHRSPWLAASNTFGLTIRLGKKSFTLYSTVELSLMTK